MPFQFNMSQVFNFLMSKTMWDCRFGNMGGYGGNGFMNSCWGNGFQMPVWGDTFKLNYSMGGGGGSSVSSLTPEEKVDKDIAEGKFETLKSTLKEWVESLGDSREELILKETFNRIGSYSDENFDKLKDFYRDNKAKVDEYVSGNGTVTPSKSSKGIATRMKNSPGVTDWSSSLLDGEKFKENKKPLEILAELGSFKDYYDKTIKGKDSTAADNLRTLCNAFFNSMKEEAGKYKDNKSVSDSNKEKIRNYISKNANEIGAKDIDEFFALIKAAMKEVATKRKEVLKDAAQVTTKDSKTEDEEE